jgi:hypothetical protein
MQRIKNNIPNFARLALGGIFVIFGLNGFLNFIPLPPPEGDAATFMGGLAAVGYFFPLLKLTEIAAGAALLANRYVPLALTVLAPISINILAMHLFVAPAGLGLAVMIVGLQLYLAWKHREAFRGVLAARAGDERTHSHRTAAAVSR